ncbi:hypothetical protein [Glutamicibacter ardleyensis]|uniref:hypothetical protein n=1 Tax=Glutamicibacter ardleyensis TaxID=225894 RepID=UPI003FD3AB9E
MSYMVRFTNGEEQSYPGNEVSYKVLDNGVLQLIHALKGDSIKVVEEISPSCWATIEGTRYDGSTHSFEGSNGKHVNGGFAKKA